MKVNIIYQTSDGPHGGGNQFLRALKQQFMNMGVYADPEEADVFLFNSHQAIDKVQRAKRLYPNKKFVHRIDGPMRLYNKMSDVRDFTVYGANDELADGTIFQSIYSRNANLSLGLKASNIGTVIPNAVDPEVFNISPPIPRSNKIRLMSSTFSPNMRKGFHFYQFLDQNLDFTNIEYVFAGNSPVIFQNIQNLGCLNSIELARELKKSSIYITASENDPCSNSLTEALSCGLPAVALRSGGHPEILLEAGEYFDSKEELLQKIELVASKIDFYRNKIKTHTIEEIAKRYLNFFRELCNEGN